MRLPSPIRLGLRRDLRSHAWLAVMLLLGCKSTPSSKAPVDAATGTGGAGGATTPAGGASGVTGGASGGSGLGGAGGTTGAGGSGATDARSGGNTATDAAAGFDTGPIPAPTATAISRSGRRTRSRPT